MTSLLRARSRGKVGGLAALLVATAALAQEPSAPLELNWRAPPDCPNQAAVLDKIRAVVGRGRAQDHQLQADATVAPIGDGFRLTLVVRAGNVAGERVIDSESCGALAGAAAVALAFLLASPDALRERDLRGGDPEPLWPATGELRRPSRPSSALAAPRPHPPTGAEPAEPPSPVRLLVHAPRAAMEVGPLPRPSFGAGLALGIRYAEWQLLAVGHAWLPQTVVSDDLSGYGAELSRLSAELWGCRAFEVSRLELAPCLQVAAHRLSGRGVGPYVTPASAAVLWPSAGAGALTRWFVLDRLAVVAGAGARIELSRPRIVIESLGTVHQLAPVSLTLSLGTEWIW